MADKNYFETLNAVNVNDKIEKKNGLSYLSWAYAWGELKKRFPDATYTVYETENGINYFTDGRTCWVKTGVTVNGLEHIEYLPIMDNRNKSIPLNSVTSFETNKSIQRSLTKAVARHGLGLYVYAGEDLPDEADGKRVEPLTEKELKFLTDRYTGDNLMRLLEYYRIDDIKEIDPNVGRNLIKQIAAKAKEKKGGAE